jgi:hypothetical protein
MLPKLFLLGYCRALLGRFLPSRPPESPNERLLKGSEQPHLHVCYTAPESLGLFLPSTAMPRYQPISTPPLGRWAK